ncbi:hypothetical protein RRG08_060000 [Elysia crispata]|uniref:Uncharacterized protein n=1 Tax=Elysia crispata TaxID=231223 RepID=A0AAE1CX47_9GAST|nr:hypothetical protein RRG08_060000 [Elysia crispata]
MSIFREFFVDIERSNASQTGGHTILSHMFQSLTLMSRAVVLSPQPHLYHQTTPSAGRVVSACTMTHRGKADILPPLVSPWVVSRNWGSLRSTALESSVFYLVAERDVEKAKTKAQLLRYRKRARNLWNRYLKLLNLSDRLGCAGADRCYCCTIRSVSAAMLDQNVPLTIDPGLGVWVLIWRPFDKPSAPSNMTRFFTLCRSWLRLTSIITILKDKETKVERVKGERETKDERVKRERETNDERVQGGKREDKDESQRIKRN